jgi:uncharacterized membrane protein YfcA
VNPAEAVVIMAAGLAAGTINAIVGSGTLITFPTLLALGFPPVVANVSNTVGLTWGAFSGVVGYRRELVGQRGQMIRLGSLGIVGGLTGAVLLLALPESAFNRIVPLLILLACLLVAFQPRLTRILARHRPRAEAAGNDPLLYLLIFGAAVYGGYFGAAQGVLMIAILAIFVADDLVRLNALKTLVSALDNGVAAILFILVAPVAWEPAILLAISSIVGGQVGAFVGRRLSPLLLRSVIVVVGLIVAGKLLIG